MTKKLIAEWCKIFGGCGNDVYDFCQDKEACDLQRKDALCSLYEAVEKRLAGKVLCSCNFTLMSELSRDADVYSNLKMKQYCRFLALFSNVDEFCQVMFVHSPGKPKFVRYVKARNFISGLLEAADYEVSFASETKLMIRITKALLGETPSPKGLLPCRLLVPEDESHFARFLMACTKAQHGDLCEAAKLLRSVAAENATFVTFVQRVSEFVVNLHAESACTRCI